MSAVDLMVEQSIRAEVKIPGPMTTSSPRRPRRRMAGGTLTDRSSAARVDGGCAVVTNGLLHATVLATPGP